MGNPESRKPLNTEALAGEVLRGSDEIDKLGARLDRYSTAKKRALENLNFLQTEVHVLQSSPLRLSADLTVERYRKGAALLSGCGNYLAFRNYYTVGKVRLNSASFCHQHLICPLCAIRRGSKTLEAYLKRYQAIRAENPHWRLSMITLTVKNGEDLEERFKHLQKAMKTIFERRRDYLKKGRGKTEFRKVHGYVGTFEFTKDNGFGEVKKTGWHPHAHIMVLHTSTFDYKALQAEWKEITGDSHVVNVTAAHHPEEPEKDFMEVFKYAVKFSDLEPSDNIYAWNVLRARRLLFSGGAFRGVTVPEELTDTPLDELPYFEMFYRYTFAGYSLLHVKSGGIEEARAG